MCYFIFIYAETHLATLCKDLLKFLASGVVLTVPESPASFASLVFLLFAHFPDGQLGPKELPLAGSVRRSVVLPGRGQREPGPPLDGGPLENLLTRQRTDPVASFGFPAALPRQLSCQNPRCRAMSCQLPVP